MGGHPWFYVVSHDSNPNRALQLLKEREFAAGRYNPAMPFPPFPIEASTPAPGPKHRSIDEAREAAAENGTRSILDMEGVADQPDYGVAAPLNPEVLIEIYGTARPTLSVVLKSDYKFLEAIEERGQGFYFTLYDDQGSPTHLLFAGYSFD